MHWAGIKARLLRGGKEIFIPKTTTSAVRESPLWGGLVSQRGQEQQCPSPVLVCRSACAGGVTRFLLLSGAAGQAGRVCPKQLVMGADKRAARLR